MLKQADFSDLYSVYPEILQVVPLAPPERRRYVPTMYVDCANGVGALWIEKYLPGLVTAVQSPAHDTHSWPGTQAYLSEFRNTAANQFFLGGPQQCSLFRQKDQLFSRWRQNGRMDRRAPCE